MSEQHQPQRPPQTMPEDGNGWHQIQAGPHLHVMFHPDRKLLGREDGIERPSIVVAVAGSGSRRSVSIRSAPAVIITSGQACAAGRSRFGPMTVKGRSMWRSPSSKSRCGFAVFSPRPAKTRSPVS